MIEMSEEPRVAKEYATMKELKRDAFPPRSCSSPWSEANRKLALK
jgi:hypothetical protein